MNKNSKPPLNRNCTPLTGFYQNYGSLPVLTAASATVFFIIGRGSCCIIILFIVSHTCIKLTVFQRNALSRCKLAHRNELISALCKLRYYHIAGVCR